MSYFIELLIKTVLCQYLELNQITVHSTFNKIWHPPELPVWGIYSFLYFSLTGAAQEQPST